MTFKKFAFVAAVSRPEAFFSLLSRSGLYLRFTNKATRDE